MSKKYDVTPSAVKRQYRKFSRWIRRTPLVSAPDIHLKLENLQVAGSFKPRGGLSRLLSLPAAVRRLGVITASMGNTATGLAYAGQVMGVPVRVVMPRMVTPVKLEATRALGAEVVLIDGVGDDALVEAMRLADQDGLTFVHPHRDPDFLTGVASVALEIMEDLPRTGTLVVPIGGGGLICASAMLARQLKPRVRIVGVQPSGAAAFLESRRQGKIVTLDRLDTIADALMLKTPASYNFDLVQKLVDDVVAVSNQEIREAMKFIFQHTRTVAEPGGAASVAAALTNKVGARKSIVCLISGGNIQPGEFAKLLQF